MSERRFTKIVLDSRALALLVQRYMLPPADVDVALVQFDKNDNGEPIANVILQSPKFADLPMGSPIPYFRAGMMSAERKEA